MESRRGRDAIISINRYALNEIMAHTKSGGSTKLGRDSAGKRLGVKINDQQFASIGEIIIRQRGAHYVAGRYVGHGSDDTLYALKSGVVKFLSRKKANFDGSQRFVKVVTIEPLKEKSSAK